MSAPTFRAPLSVDMSEVHPEVVAAYLERHGWVRSTIAATWAVLRYSRDGVEVCVPNGPPLVDWRRRLVEAVQDIASVENRAELDVARDLGMLVPPCPPPPKFVPQHTDSSISYVRFFGPLNVSLRPETRKWRDEVFAGTATTDAPGCKSRRVLDPLMERLCRKVLP